MLNYNVKEVMNRVCNLVYMPCKCFAISLQGVIQKCLTEGNSCYFTNMMCGEHYNFSVQTIAGRCSSQNSATVDIRTGMTRSSLQQ